MILITRKRNKNQPVKKDYTKVYLVLIVVSIIFFSGVIYLSIESKNPDEKESWGDAPDFTLTTLDDETFTLSDNLGKVILIDFTAEKCTWCGEGGYDQFGNPIRGQIYELLDLYEEVGSEVVFISIDPWYAPPIYETEDDLRSFKERYNSNWIYAMDNYEEDVAGNYQADSGIPKIILIDKNGNVYDSFSTLTSAGTLLNSINKIL